MLCWHQLQPLVKVILLYIKDTNGFINKTNFKVPEDSFLVTMDVKAFYTCIPNNEGNAAVKQKHDNYTKKNIVSKSRSHIFILNNSSFNSKFYIQIKGHGNNMLSDMRKHIHVRIQRKINLSPY